MPIIEQQDILEMVARNHQAFVNLRIVTDALAGHPCDAKTIYGRPWRRAGQRGPGGPPGPADASGVRGWGGVMTTSDEREAWTRAVDRRLADNHCPYRILVGVGERGGYCRTRT